MSVLSRLSRFTRLRATRSESSGDERVDCVVCETSIAGEIEPVETPDGPMHPRCRRFRIEVRRAGKRIRGGGGGA